MDGFRRCLPLLVALGTTGLSGASCPHVFQPWPPPPRVISQSPTLEEVIQVVNRNNGQIQSLTTTQASLSGSGFPTLRANLAFQRPKRLRLRADFMAAPEVDLGTNEELFWFWVKRSQPPALFYCRHEQFATSRARHLTPVEPEWLIEALGLGEFDRAFPHQGPFPLPGDRLEVRTIRETAEGPATKVTILDGAQGWILEQRLHDAQGRLLASSQTSRHRRDPLTGLVTPTLVSVDCPPAGFAMRLDLGNVQVNCLPSNLAELWTVPQYQGYPAVDLGDPNLSWPSAAPPAAVSARQPAWPLRR